MQSELLNYVPVETFVYPKYFKERVPFISDECRFTPCGWAKIEGQFYPLGYKIVTDEMKSLGLRKNPSIMTFPIGEWVKLPDEEVIVGKKDAGGIWTAISKGSIKTLKNYMLEMYAKETRAFLTAMDRPVYANSYRIKSQGVMLLEEIL
jgi:hypothetical protein